MSLVSMSQHAVAVRRHAVQVQGDDARRRRAAVHLLPDPGHRTPGRSPAVADLDLVVVSPRRSARRARRARYPGRRRTDAVDPRCCCRQPTRDRPLVVQRRAVTVQDEPAAGRSRERRHLGGKRRTAIHSGASAVPVEVVRHTYLAGPRVPAAPGRPPASRPPSGRGDEGLPAERGERLGAAGRPHAEHDDRPAAVRRLARGRRARCSGSAGRCCARTASGWPAARPRTGRTASRRGPR